LMHDGELGAVRHFESGFERYEPDQGPGPAGGGVLLDFGSHLVDQALVLFGPVKTVYCELRQRDTGLDDDTFVALTHAGGVRSHLWGSWSQHAPGLRFRVTGTEATYLVPGPMDSQEAQILNGMIPGTDGWGVEPAHRWGHLVRRDDEDVTVPTLPGCWDTFYPAFARAVRGVGDVPVAVEDAVRTATVLDAARASASCGEVITV
jgi:predicted dehydrogenase